MSWIWTRNASLVNRMRELTSAVTDTARKHSSRMRTARVPTVHALVSPLDVSTGGAGEVPCLMSRRGGCTMRSNTSWRGLNLLSDFYSFLRRNNTSPSPLPLPTDPGSTTISIYPLKRTEMDLFKQLLCLVRAYSHQTNAGNTDQRINDKHQRKFSLSLPFMLGVNGP